MRIRVSKSKLSGEIKIPGSKSHTIRGIISALMGNGESELINPLVSDDTESCLYAARKLGAKFKDEYKNGSLVWKITGNGGILTNPRDQIIDLGNSGTTLRLLTGIVATSELKVCFDGDSSLRGRPMGTLISALEKMGAKIYSAEGGRCPLSIKGPITGGDTIIEGKSSQFVSSLLFAAPVAKNDTTILAFNVNEKPYIDMTLSWLNFLGIKYEVLEDYTIYKIKGNQQYRPFVKRIPADFSTSTFPLIAAGITQSRIEINNLDFDDMQGDKLVFLVYGKNGNEN